MLITLHACTRGKVIGSVVIVIMSTKITKSQKMGIGQNALHVCRQTVEVAKKYPMFASNRLGHPWTLQIVHFHWPRLSTTHPCATVHARSRIGKGHPRQCTALQPTQGTRLHFYCNGDIAMAYRVCALKSSSDKVFILSELGLLPLQASQKFGCYELTLVF